MPQDRICYTPLVRAALGVVLAAFVVCANSAARAGDDDSDDPSFLTKFMNTLGLKLPGNDDVNYSERSPLVVPPTRDLPPPVAAEIKAEKTKVERSRNNVVEDSRPLRPDELDVPGAKPAPSAGNSQQAQNNPPNPPKKSIFNLDWLNPNKEEYATFTGEPSRTSLTDPPPGYQTPSPDQPYGIAPEKKAAKIQTLGERLEPQR